jgi:hypothetical protein
MDMIAGRVKKARDRDVNEFVTVKAEAEVPPTTPRRSSHWVAPWIRVEYVRR